MAHKKSKKVFYCKQINHNIMASYCKNCPYINFSGAECPMGNLFNDCKIVSENCKKDIDKAKK